MLSGEHKTLTGLIGASAPGGTQYGINAEWLLVIHLAAWRYAGSPITESTLRLEMPVSRSELDTYMAALEPYQIIEVAVLDGDRPDLKRVSAITRSHIDDPDLAAVAERLQIPVELRHPVFGRLVYNREFGWYEGRALWNDQAVDLTLICEDPDQPDQVLAASEALFREQAHWTQRVTDYAVEQLLALKNDVWLEDDEDPITPAAFIQRMTLESIAVDEDGEFTFWYDDGDLFWGHAIQIGGDLVNGLTLADIPG